MIGPQHLEADAVKEAAGERGSLAVLRALGVDTEAGSRRGGNLDGLRLPPALGRDTNASFSVHLTEWTCHDFGGHFDGTLFQLVEAARGCTFPEAVGWVAGVCGIAGGAPGPPPPDAGPHRPREEPETEAPPFWTPERRRCLRAAQGLLSPGHALARMALERDGLTAETLGAFGCGVWKRYDGGEWLAFPYPSGAQLYRREGGEKVLKAVSEKRNPSRPKESFFGETRLKPGGAAAHLVIAKSPRETMLVAQTCPEAAVVGLPGGEKKELSDVQARFLRGIRTTLPDVRRVSVSLDCDTPEAERTARSFAASVAAAFGADGTAEPGAVCVGLVNVHALTGGTHKDLSDVARAGGSVPEMLAQAEPVEADTADDPERDVSTETPPLPWLPFPVDALPVPLAAYVTAHAAALDADPAFVAVPALAALAAAVGNSHRVRLKRSWEEPGALWAVVVADSGSGKSPALHAALEPVFSLEREAREMHEQERELYEIEKRAHDALTKKQQGEKPPPQLAPRRRYRVGDTTVESVVFVHEQNPRGLLLARDEMAGWLGSFDRYARGESDMQAWIEMHGGRPVVIDRKSSDQPVLTLDSPNVCAAGTIQPDVLRRQLTPLHLSSGFAARLLLAEPPERPKRWTDADVTPDVSAAYHRLIRGLYDLPYSPDAGPAVLGLTPGAQAAFVAFVNENGAKQHALPSGPLRAALSKHEALAARLALHLHLADAVASGQGSSPIPPGPVSAEAMGRAVHLARWFRYETARLYERYGIEEQAVDRDERLAADLPDTFAWRDVSEAWEVGRSGAYVVLDRLRQKGLAEDAGHGRFRRSAPKESPGGLLDFVDFDTSKGQLVHKVHKSTHPLPENAPPEGPPSFPSGDGTAGPPPADPAEPWEPWADEDETGLSL